MERPGYLSNQTTGLHNSYHNYFRVCERFSFQTAINGARIVDDN